MDGKSETLYREHVCPVCGHTFRERKGARGRPRVYDTPECRRLQSRQAEVYGLLAWLKGTHRVTNQRAAGLFSEAMTAANVVNPRGRDKTDPQGWLPVGVR